MSSDPMWKRDANGIEHPTSETLLAFMRAQCTEHEKSRINEHLLTGCVPCNRVRAGLTPSSNALNRLKHMSRYLYYPELQSNQVLLHAQRGEPLTSVWTGKRKRKFQAQRKPQATGLYARKVGLRYMSIPAAFGIFLIVAVIAIALAYAIVTINSQSNLDRQTDSRLYNSTPNTPVIAQHQVTPTEVTITPSPTVSVTLTPTVTAIAVKGPAINNCLSANYTGTDIFICGYGFQANDKILLEVDYFGSNSLQTVGPFTAKGGEFKASWSVPCRNLPVTIYAVDETRHTMTTALTIFLRFGCSGPTPTVTSDQRGHQ